MLVVMVNPMKLFHLRLRIHRLFLIKFGLWAFSFHFIYSFIHFCVCLFVFLYNIQYHTKILNIFTVTKIQGRKIILTKKMILKRFVLITVIKYLCIYKYITKKIQNVNIKCNFEMNTQVT